MKKPQISMRPAGRSLVPCLHLIAIAAGLVSPVAGQNAPAPSAQKTAAQPAAGETINLSPFVVEAGADDKSYQATSTATTSRLSSQLKDLAAQVSVYTPEFLQDIGAINLEEAYLYSSNTETYLEFADPSNIGFGSFLLRNNTRVRGLSSMNTLRSQFVTNIEADMYNSERFTVTSGPNSVLFGQPGQGGNAGGSTDVSALRARLNKNHYEAAYRVDSFGSQRYSAKLNQVLWKDKLAVAAAGLHDWQKYLRDPTYDRNERVYGALTFRPFKKTEIRFDQEATTRVASRAPAFTPYDFVTPWIDAGSVPFNNAPGFAAPPATSIFTRYGTASPIYVYPESNTAVNYPLSPFQNNRFVQVKGPNQLPGVLSVDNGSRSLVRPELYDVYANLFGFGRQTRQRGKNYHVYLEQEITKDFAVELSHGYDLLREKDGGYSNAGTTNPIQVDPNRFLPDGTTPNPNLGRLYVQDHGRLNNRIIRDKESRLAASYNLDLAKNTGWTRWLGRHRIGGLLSNYDQINRAQTFSPLIVGTPSFIQALAQTDPTVLSNLNHPARQFFTRYYFDLPGSPSNRGRYYREDIVDQHATVVIKDPVTGEGITVAKHDLPDGAALVTGGTKRNIIGNALLAQSFFWNDRVVVTAGTKRERTRSAGIRLVDRTLMANGLFPRAERTRFDPYTNYEADAVTNYGVVVTPLPWVSLRYNYAENYSPASTSLDPFGKTRPGANGEGKDYGLRFSFLGDRLSLQVNYYDNRRENEVQAGAAIRNVPFAIEQRIRRDIAPSLPAAGLDAITRSLGDYTAIRDLKATGLDIEGTFNPDRNWSFRVTAGTQKTITYGQYQDWIDWTEARKGTWQTAGAGWDTVTLDPSGTQTIRQAYDQWAAQERDVAIAESGRRVVNQRNLRVNLWGKYQFTSGRLAGLQVGGGLRYRSAAVIGYGAILNRGGRFERDPAKVYENDPEFYPDFFASYSLKVRTNYTCRLQLNIRDVGQKRGLIPIQTLSDGTPSLYGYRQPQQTTFSVTLGY